MKRASRAIEKRALMEIQYLLFLIAFSLALVVHAVLPRPILEEQGESFRARQGLQPIKHAKGWWEQKCGSNC